MSQSSIHVCRGFAAALILVLAASLAYADPSFRLVASFVPSPQGADPSGELVLGPNGNYYGTTQTGGLYGGGTVFMVTPAGVFTSVASLNPATTGGTPLSIILGQDGSFYGACESGGPNNFGTIFKMSPDGTLTLLHAFTGADGESPDYVVQGLDGYLYPSFGFGATFDKISTVTGSVTTFYNGPGDSGPLTFFYSGTDGYLYGASDREIVKMSPLGQLTTLYSPLPSALAYAYLIPGPNGVIYGASQYGGTFAGGSIFELDPSGTLTTLASFGLSSNNSSPYQFFLGADGNFYGSAAEGIFEATPSGTVTTLAAAPLPDGLVQAANGDLFWEAGRSGFVQRLSKGVVSTLYTFTSTGVVNPTGPVIQGKDSNFYGVCGSGGTSGYGGVYKVTPAGDLSTLASFPAFAYAGYPIPFELTQASDGNFYGIYPSGPSGAIFKVSPSGMLTTLHSFNRATDGAPPDSRLVQGPDGNLYGLTPAGGSLNSGTFFKISTSGAFNVVAGLGSGLAQLGSSPYQLVLGKDGNFYAASSTYIFRISLAGKQTLLAPLSASSGFIVTALALAPDGNFYGTTTDGGTFHTGCLFRMTPRGTLTTIYSFGPLGAQKADYPTSLAFGNDGNFYVTVQTIDQQNTGGLVQITPTGTASLIPYGASAFDGLNSIIQGADGTLYGTTQGGLVSGTLFNVNPDLLSGTIIGTPGSFSYDPGNTIDKVFDGNLSTYFDAPSPGNGDWVGLDLGSVQPITAIAYAPRVHFESRMLGGVFQGSNTPDFSSGVVNLAPPITAFPHDGFNTVIVSGSYRYVRYLSPPRGYGNISELEVYSTPPPAVAP